MQVHSIGLSFDRINYQLHTTMLDIPISGTADVSQGGTGKTSVTSNALLIGNGTGPLQEVPAGSAGQVLTINNSGVPQYITPQGGGGGGTTVTAGQFEIQNTSGGTLGTLTVAIPNAAITATSVITLGIERSTHSASGVEYIAQIVSRQPGVGFTVDFHRSTPSGSASFVNNEGCILNYMIVG